jgi:DNA-binding NarL/FixJ family response regulator
MAGGTLIVSRAENLYPFFKKHAEALGFVGVAVTGVGKDGLSMLIREMEPGIVIMDSIFYQCCTPFLLADLHKQFPKLNIAVISIYDYPADRAMCCIFNGAKSYASFWEGEEQFYQGLKEIRDGHEYVSPEVQRRIDMRSYVPDPAGTLMGRQIEIVRLVCNGFTGAEIADTLHISERSVDSRKSEIYTVLNVRNENELIRVAIYLEIIKAEELNFFGRDYKLKPLPETQCRSNGDSKRVTFGEMRLG